MDGGATEPAPGSLVYDDDDLLDILKRCRTIAMVGASPRWNRPSNFVMKYLQAKGYRVIPVNPAAAGEKILGERVHPSLSEVPDRFDMVDIFRRAGEVPALVDEAVGLASDRGISTIWMQLGIVHGEAARAAREAGLAVIMDRCVKIEFGRLSGELGWGGINTGIVSSRRRKLIS